MTWAAALAVALATVVAAGAAPEATVEVFDPYETWLEGERWGVYIRVTNTGSEAFPLLFNPGTEQLFLEPTFGEPSKEGLSRSILETPLPSVEEAQWEVVEKAAAAGQAVEVRPGEQFVYGPEAVIDIEGLHALMYRRMSSYQFHLLLGDGMWVTSPVAERRFVIDKEAWQADPIAEIPLRIEGVSAPVREITVDGETWLFKGHNRLCRPPAGHRPEFGFDEGTRNFLNITFEGIDNGDIRADNRMGYPISGPPELLPQLALWQRLTGRPMGWATAETRAEPAEQFQVPLNGDQVEEVGNANPAEPGAQAPTGGISTNAPSVEASTNAAFWAWLAASACLLLGALWLFARRTST